MNQPRLDQQPGREGHEEPGADELEESEADYAAELASHQAKKSRPYWKWILWLIIAIAIGAIQHFMINQRTGEALEKLQSDLETRTDRNAEMFAQLRQLKEQKGRGVISADEYRERRNQITGKQP